MNKHFRRLAAAAGLFLALTAPGLAADRQQDIDKADAYLNAITTLKAHFLQAAPNGDISEGTVYLSRPGRLRLEYDPPSPILVVTHGTFLVYYDKSLNQTSYVDVDSTPAGVLVKAKVKLDQDDLQVTKVSRKDGLVLITVTKRDEASQGAITLIFTEEPFQLRQWKVLDQQGQITTVTLSDAHPGVSLDKALFEFQDPNFSTEPDLSTKHR